MTQAQSSPAFSLDHLRDTDFEDFCYALLLDMGFVNLNWRKGTGLDASPADQGRDIECEWSVTDADGGITLEKWYVQCKHYKKGVPPEKLTGILAWATAGRPDKALIIASSFLSNPAKEFIEQYKQTNKPTFKIKIWERPDLERVTAGRSRLLRKYKVSGHFPYLALLHPAHIAFLKTTIMVSLNDLFSFLDKLDQDKRDHLLFWPYLLIMEPEFRSEHQTVRELMNETVTYEGFKAKCRSLLDGEQHGHILASWIVTFILHEWLKLGDTTSLDEQIEANKEYAEELKSRMETEPEKKDVLQKLIDMHRDKIKSAKEDTEKSYGLYVYFCENVLEGLIARSSTK